MTCCLLQYIPRNMHTVFALLCFVVVIHWLISPYPSGLLHWHCGNLTIAPVPAKQPWWIWINTSCEFIMNDCITTTKLSTTKPCAYFLGYTVGVNINTDLLSCVHQWTTFSNTEIKSQTFKFKEMHFKMLPANCQPFSSHLNFSNNMWSLSTTSPRVSLLSKQTLCIVHRTSCPYQCQHMSRHN